MTPDVEARFERIEALLERTITHMAETQARTDLEIHQLTQAQKHTDERLDALINVVDRMQADWIRRQAAQEAFNARFDQFLERFDRFISGQSGNGHGVGE